MGGASASGGGIGHGTTIGSPEGAPAVILTGASARDAAVRAVTSTGTSPGLLILAAGSGGFAALVVVSLVAARWPSLSTPLALSLAAAMIWGAVAWWALHNALRRRVVLRRGFGLGAWLWLGLSLAHEPMAHAGTGSSSVESDGLLAFAAQLADPLALIMVWVCALAYSLLWCASRAPRRACMLPSSTRTGS